MRSILDVIPITILVKGCYLTGSDSESNNDSNKMKIEVSRITIIR